MSYFKSAVPTVGLSTAVSPAFTVTAGGGADYNIKNISIPSWLKASQILGAYIEFRCNRIKNTAAMQNSLTAGAILTSPDGGTSYNDVALSLVNCMQSDSSETRNQTYSIMGDRDVSEDLINSILAVVDFYIVIKAAAAAQNSLSVYDSQYVLNVVFV